MPRPDPYADLAEVYAEETSLKRLTTRAVVTEKKLTDEDERVVSTATAKWMRLRAILGGEIGSDGEPLGFHIDGDPRYFER